MPPVFAHGQLRLYLLALLEQRPMHGYEVITALSDRFGGTYRPSAGTIYPRRCFSFLHTKFKLILNKFFLNFKLAFL